MYNDSASTAELDDFLSRAEAVNAAVTGLASGELDAGDTDDLLKQLEREAGKRAPVDPAVAAYRAEQAAKAEEERLRKGVKGQGARPGYLYFCRHCFLEFELEPLPALGGGTSARKCAQCSHALETREQRMEELNGKVALLRERKEERARRRQAYEQWKREKLQPGSSVIVGGTAAAASSAVKVEEITDESAAAPVSAASSAAPGSRSLATSYAGWDFWEPSSDEEEDDSAMPAGPEFAAMKADLDSREKKKRAARVVSESANEQGNALLARADYLGAVEAYSRAIDATRDEKRYYSNRALARLHAFDYAGAIKDAYTVLDIFECFEVGKARFENDAKNTKVVFKSMLRRGKAQIALGMFAECREGLAQAAALLKKVYALPGRQSAEYAKAQKADLAELEKLSTELKEKEAFAKEGESVGVKSALAATTTAASAAGAEKDAAVAPPAAANDAAQATAVSAVSTADNEVLSTLLASLSSSTKELLSSAPASAASTVPPAAANWTLLAPALQFLHAALEGEGNKERVISHVESRSCVDVLLKILKRRAENSKGAAKAPAAAAGAAALPAALPDFGPALSLLSPSNSSRLSHGVWWRERDGFAALGRFLNQLLSRIPSAGASVPLEILSPCVKTLMILTDREGAREMFSGPSFAPTLTETIVEVLRAASPAALGAPSSSTSSTAAELLSLQLSASNLLANMSFQPRYRSWLAADEQNKVVDSVFHATLAKVSSCAWTSGKGDAATGEQKTGAVLSAGLSAVLNLLTFIGCRVSFTESLSSAKDVSTDSSASSPAGPLTLILSALTSLTAAWEKLSYRVAAGSILAELSDKVLSIVLNLAVDDFANARVFTSLLGTPSTLVSLLKLASRPAEESAPDDPASGESVRSSLPPLLVERSLGVLTRGLRREHNAAQAAEAQATAAGGGGSKAKPVARPIRDLLAKSGAPIAVLRILALHRFAASEEAVTADSVLAKLAVEPAAAASASPSPSAASSAPSSFRYTRLTMEHASVCMAIFLSHDPPTAASVAATSWQGSSGLRILVSLLSSPSRNISGNGCLCIDGLAANPSLLGRPELSEALPLLLEVLKDPLAKAAHQNAAKAAIVIGRAPNNAEAWTKLRGLEIIAKTLAPKLLNGK